MRFSNPLTRLIFLSLLILSLCVCVVVRFLTAMSALEKGDPEAKTRFFFQIYDLDADGYISRADLSTMFHSSSMLDDDETTAEVVSTFVNKVFKEFKADQSGKISFDDCLKYIKSHPGEDVWNIFGRSMISFGGL